jgi:hypothetical protein
MNYTGKSGCEYVKIKVSADGLPVITIQKECCCNGTHENTKSFAQGRTRRNMVRRKKPENK